MFTFVGIEECGNPSTVLNVDINESISWYGSGYNIRLKKLSSSYLTPESFLAHQITEGGIMIALIPYLAKNTLLHIVSYL